MIDKITATLGLAGRMLSGSKASYCLAHPDHEVFFNANIFDSNYRQIWYGDIDLTLDYDILKELAKYYGTLYVTREHPFRFKGFKESYADFPDYVRKFEND